MQQALGHITQWASPVARKLPMAVWLGMGAGVLLSVSLLSWAAYRTQGKLTTAVAAKKSVQVAGPLNVDFSQDVAAGYKATITPAVAGKWVEDRTILGVSGLAFKPAGRFEAGRTYSLRITGLKRAMTGAALPEIRETFTAQTPPDVKSFSPAADAKNIGVKPKFSVTLAEANRGVRDLQPQLAPEAKLKLVSSDDRSYSWEPEAPLKQGVAYVFVLNDVHMEAADKRRLVTIPFTTVSEPKIVSARTGGLFGPGQKIDIVFDQPMERDDNAFSFDVGGKGEWADDKTYKFTPTGLTPGKTYNYKVKAGLKSKAGGVLETEKPYQFATNGAVAAASMSPGGSGVSVGSAIKISFDQAVDHASAERLFKISPAVGGKFSWSGNTMTYTTTGLAHQTTYRYEVAPGVAPVWGLPSSQTMARSFVTENRVIKLNVPAYKQMYPMSCNLSALRMMLAYRGVYVNDNDILNKVGYSPRPRDKANNFWDDPNQMYVGYLTGIPITDGYGVHSGPIANAAKSFGRNATAHWGVSAAFIAGQIYAGNPVQVWGHSAPTRSTSWNTTNGVIQATTSQHSRVVIGVVGSADNPVGFYMQDPWDGSSYYWSTHQLMANMNAALPASNQAVIVY